MARIFGTSNNGSYLYVDYSIGAQDIAGNFTDVSWTVGVHWGTYYFNIHDAYVNMGTNYGSVGGSTGTGVYNSGWPVSGAAPNKDFPFSSGTTRVYHDASGNGNITFNGSAWWDTPSNFTSTLSSAVGLAQIPRFPSAPGTPSVSGYADSDPTTATITWTAPSNVGAGLTQRQIQISTSNAFSSTIVDSTATWGTSYSAGGLGYATTYYVRVRAYSSAGAGPWSATQSFTTGTTPPSAPGTPTVDARTYTTIDLSWTPPSSDGGSAITGYTVERTNSGGTVQQSYSASGTSYTVTGLTAGTTYYFRVRAKNVNGAGTASSLRTTSTLTATAPDAAAAPTFTNVQGTSLTASWAIPGTNGAAITSFTLQRSTTSGTTGFTDLITGISASATSVQVTGLDYGATYWFRLVANSSAGSSTGASASVTMGSTTPFAPAAPTVSNIGQVTATVSYVAPDTGGLPITGYDIQRATDLAFTQNVVTTPDTASPLDITGLLPGTTHYVRVRAKNANGPGAWSPAASFTAVPSAWIYKGGVWAGCQVYVWKGAWVLATTQKWSGTAWV